MMRYDKVVLRKTFVCRYFIRCEVRMRAETAFVAQIQTNFVMCRTLEAIENPVCSPTLSHCYSR